MNLNNFHPLADKITQTLVAISNNSLNSEVPEYLQLILNDELRKVEFSGNTEDDINILLGFFKAVSDSCTVPDDDPIINCTLDLLYYCEQD